MQFGDLQIWNETEFKRRSRQLDLLARGDFSPVADEIASLYPNTPLQVRAIPFVVRYVGELSQLYARTPIRRFTSTSVAQATWQTLQAAYEASQVDRVLHAVEQALWVQNTVFLAVLPDGLGRVRVQPVLPWQIEDVQIADALRADDPAAWSRVVVQVPSTVAAGQVIFGRMTLTPTEAWRDVSGKRVGVYAADGSHPFGRVPLIAVHRIRPDSGRHCAPVNEACLNLQMAISCQQADNELIVRHCAFPQRVIEGADGAQDLIESINLGPDKVWVIRGSGDDRVTAPTLRVVQGQVPVSELVAFAEHQIKLYCSMLGLDPANFISVNTSVTAAARLFAAQDRAAQRDKIIPVLEAMERELLRLIVQVLRVGQPLPVPQDLGVVVQYLPFEASPDPLNAASALETEIRLGVSSAVDAVVARDGVGRTEAMRVVQRNLAEGRALGLVPDKVETTEPDPQDPGEPAEAEAEPVTP